jgi:hypothetical protein
MVKKLLILTFISLILMSGNAYAKESTQKTNEEPHLEINITSIVVTALVLGFSYSALKSFKNTDG